MTDNRRVVDACTLYNLQKARRVKLAKAKQRQARVDHMKAATSRHADKFALGGLLVLILGAIVLLLVGRHSHWW